MKSAPRLNALVMLASLSLGIAQAGSAAEFSAQSVVVVPQQPEKVTELYVGSDAMRREASQGGEQQIEILNLAKQALYVIRPGSKQYMQLPLPPGATLPGAKVDPDPCKSGVPPGVSCRLSGEEKVFGRTALKWAVTGSVQGTTVSATHWIDSEYSFPLKQEVDGVVVLEQRLIGVENIDGRDLERWEAVSTSPDGKAVKSIRWYDPELRMPYRQEMSNGFKQTLRNLRVEAQPASLFAVPAGYERVEPQQRRPQ